MLEGGHVDDLPEGSPYTFDLFHNYFDLYSSSLIRILRFHPNSFS